MPLNARRTMLAETPRRRTELGNEAHEPGTGEGGGRSPSSDVTHVRALEENDAA